MDQALAEIDIEVLPPAVRYGVAPAMNADPKRMYWGGDKHSEAGKVAEELCGCDPKFENKDWGVKEAINQRLIPGGPVLTGPANPMVRKGVPRYVFSLFFLSCAPPCVPVVDDLVCLCATSL